LQPFFKLIGVILVHLQTENIPDLVAAVPMLSNNLAALPLASFATVSLSSQAPKSRFIHLPEPSPAEIPLSLSVRKEEEVLVNVDKSNRMRHHDEDIEAHSDHGNNAEDDLFESFLKETTFNSPLKPSASLSIPAGSLNI
jgi:hypothetical protein